MHSITQLIFICVLIATLYFFYRASNNSKIVLAVLITWIFIQSILSLNGFYLKMNTIPPRFMFLVFPPILSIILLATTPKGKLFLNNLNIKWITLIHVVRIPVEIVLYLLFQLKLIPQLMTFEGRNFDILSGITAFIVYYYAIQKGLKKSVLIIWNLIALCMVLNIMVYGFLSSPSLLQQFAFEQPNIAVLYFPMNLLPSFVVPIVILCHLASLKKLLSSD